MKSFRIDIDNTLLESYIDDRGNYKIISSNNIMIDMINDLYDRGHIIIIETGRHWNHLELTIEHLKTIGVKYHTLIMGKPPADYNIDDKNYRPIEFKGLYETLVMYSKEI